MPYWRSLSWRARGMATGLLALTLLGAPPAVVAQARVPDSSPGASLDELRVRAQVRMAQDREHFTREELREIEQLYQGAGRDFSSPETRAKLARLIEKYPGSNRAGCAALYLARSAPPDERETELLAVIAEHSDAWYGDGTQVGPMARAFLASWYQAEGRDADARDAAREIAAQAPDAVDHTGRRIVDVMRGIGLLP